LYRYLSDLRNQLEAILNEIGRINIFKFVVNPNDFAQSVENIFYLSFLIRDGKVAFETENGEPVICKTLDVSKAVPNQDISHLRAAFRMAREEVRTKCGRSPKESGSLSLSTNMDGPRSHAPINSSNSWWPSSRKSQKRRIRIRISDTDF
jgi:hypothetical protein